MLRFDDPAEEAASTALRERRTEALVYYLDHDRVHVGGIMTMAHAVLDAWTQDHANGLHALTLAPTKIWSADSTNSPSLACCGPPVRG